MAQQPQDEWVDVPSDDEWEDAQPDLRTAEPAEKAFGGFAANALSSGKRFVTDSLSGLGQIFSLASRIKSGSDADKVQLGRDFIALVKSSPDIAQAIYESGKDRYGSPEKMMETMYTDPVGALADASTIFGGVGLGAKAVKMPGIVSAAQKMERLTSPLGIVTAPAAKVARGAGLGIVVGTVRPGKALRDTHGGSRAIAETIVDEGLTSGKTASTATTRARQQVDDLLARKDAERPVVRGYLPPAQEAVPLGITPQPVGGMPSLQAAEMTQPRKVGSVGNVEELAQRQWTPAYGASVDSGAAVGDVVSGPGIVMRPMGPTPGPGAPPTMVDPRRVAAPIRDARSAVGQRALGVEDVGQIDDLQSRFLESHSRPMSLTATNALKRAEQDLADRAYRSQAAGHPINAVETQFHQAIARGAREAVEAKVPEVAPMNQRTRNLAGASEALHSAEDRSQALTNMLASGFGIGAGAVDPLAGISAAVAMKALNSPRVGATTGIALDRAGRFLDTDLVRRTLLTARLLENNDDNK